MDARQGCAGISTGFLLNHLISEYLPADPSGRRASNSDPITGQAAWFDLTVRIERCAPHELAETAPHPPPLTAPFKPVHPHILRFGAKHGEVSR